MISDSVLNYSYAVGALYILYRLYKKFWVGDVEVHTANSPRIKTEKAKRQRKSCSMAYLLLLAGGGSFGAHHIYLGNYACSLLYAWTIGLCGLGTLFDFFTLWYQVQAVNKRNRATGEVDAKATHIYFRALCKLLPLAMIATCLWWLLVLAFTPTLLDRVGVVDLYAARAGMERNPFDVLEVPRHAPFEVTKKNFRALSLKYHPDRNPSCADCASKMADFNSAYEIIKKLDSTRPTDFFDNCMQEWIAIGEYFARFANATETGKSGKKGKRAKKDKEDRRRAASAFFEDVLEKVIRAGEQYTSGDDDEL